MNVVHLNTSDFGGAAMAAVQLHEALLEQGVSSDLLTLNKTRTDIPRHHLVDPFQLGGNEAVNRAKYKARRALEIAGLVEDKHNAPANKNLLHRPPGHEIFTLPYSFFPIWEHPLVQAADVVHLHWVSYGMIDYLGFFANCKRRIIWTMHDMYPFTGGCHHADDCTGYERTCEACPQLRYPDKAHVYWTYKRDALATVPADRLQLVAPSQWLANKATRSTLFHERPCAVIPNGFDVEVFRYRQGARESLGLPQDKRMVLFNALDVTNSRKGMQLLLPALQLLKEPDVLLVAVGGGGGSLPAGSGIHDAGYITSAETLAKYYSAADLVVLPSLSENLPNTISESLLCGTPVAAFNVGGIPEQVGPEDGVLIQGRTVEDLAAGLGEALSGTWSRVAIAERARQRYDRRAVARAYHELYTA